MVFRLQRKSQTSCVLYCYRLTHYSSDFSFSSLSKNQSANAFTVSNVPGQYEYECIILCEIKFSAQVLNKKCFVSSSEGNYLWYHSGPVLPFQKTSPALSQVNFIQTYSFWNHVNFENKYVNTCHCKYFNTSAQNVFFTGCIVLEIACMTAPPE